MSDQERQKWNRRHGADQGPPAAPHPFLVGLDDRLPRSGRALDVAGGTGRHALWLARRGLEAVLVDISEEGLARAGQEATRQGLALQTLALDLDETPLPIGPFAVIVCTCFLHRAVYAGLAGRLAAGGVLVMAHPTRTNLERHASPGAAHLLENGELPGLVAAPELEVLAGEEGWFDGRHEARLAIRRSAH